MLQSRSAKAAVVGAVGATAATGLTFGASPAGADPTVCEATEVCFWDFNTTPDQFDQMTPPGQQNDPDLRNNHYDIGGGTMHNTIDWVQNKTTDKCLAMWEGLDYTGDFLGYVAPGFPRDVPNNTISSIAFYPASKCT